MADYVLKSPSEEAFMQAAYALGYCTADEDGKLSLIPTGVTSDAGNYFVNIVGSVYEPTGETTEGPMGPQRVMAAIPGYWVRIRVNNGGEIPAVPEGFTLYPPVKYLEDRQTVDPDYVQPPYGMIA
jgi:hypothetical protein